MMGADAIQKIVDLAEAVEPITESGGLDYSPKKLTLIAPPLPSPVVVRSLQSFVDLCMLSVSNELKELLVQVVSPSIVKLISAKTDDYEQRPIHAIADVSELVDNFEFDKFHTQDQFIIDLQACFSMDDNLAKVIECASIAAVNDEAAYSDDGVSQTINAKAGVTLQKRMTLPNPVLLKPYKTFGEIAPVAQQYVFRVEKNNDRPRFALFESKSQMWELVVIESIKTHLKKLLPESLKVV